MDVGMRNLQLHAYQIWSQLEADRLVIPWVLWQKILVCQIYFQMEVHIRKLYLIMTLTKHNLLYLCLWNISDRNIEFRFVKSRVCFLPPFRRYLQPRSYTSVGIMNNPSDRFVKHIFFRALTALSVSAISENKRTIVLCELFGCVFFFLLINKRLFVRSGLWATMFKKEIHNRIQNRNNNSQFVLDYRRIWMKYYCGQRCDRNVSYKLVGGVARNLNTSGRITPERRYEAHSS